MPYPDSPFTDNFNTLLLTNIKDDYANTSFQMDLKETLKWLCTSPKITSYRVNTIKCDSKYIQDLIEKKLAERNLDLKVYTHPELPETVIIEHKNEEESLSRYEKEVIVDIYCGAAVLRGANIFRPGVMGLVSGAKLQDNVSIYVDLKNKCKKGLNKIFEGEKVFIGNGIVYLDREELFGAKMLCKESGVAISLTETISGCPSLILNDEYFPRGFALLQNLPSIICVHNLNPQPNEVILDMCASPGNKTTHIAQLMQNTGVLVALDKTANKVARLKERCKEFESNVHIFLADSTKIAADFVKAHPEEFFQFDDGPVRFACESFDKILLDAPCSALGKRPQFHNPITEKVLTSYVPLQRKLFAEAVKLLKPSGLLVYSTCTITVAENEGIVAWALRTFPCLMLKKPDLCLGGPGWETPYLSEENRRLVQRFGPKQTIDSVGFFIACFIKKM